MDRLRKIRRERDWRSCEVDELLQMLPARGRWRLLDDFEDYIEDGTNIGEVSNIRGECAVSFSCAL